MTRFDEAYTLRYNQDQFAPIAQRIAQLPSKQWVVGSNPTGGAFVTPTSFFGWRKDNKKPVSFDRRASSADDVEGVRHNS
jgi:hypothetical protein